MISRLHTNRIEKMLLDNHISYSILIAISCIYFAFNINEHLLVGWEHFAILIFNVASINELNKFLPFRDLYSKIKLDTNTKAWIIGIITLILGVLFQINCY